MIIIDWFNQSIKIDTHSPNGLNCYWLLLIFIDNWLRSFIARGSVDLRHKSRAYCVSTITRLHSFPCFDQSHGIVTKHLFPDFTCSRPMLVFEIAKQVELSIRCVVKGYHKCPFKSSLLVLFGTYTKRLLCKFEKNSIAMGCDHYRNTRLDFVLVLQFTVRQNLLMLFLDPGFHHC